MAQTIKLKRSSSPNTPPTTSQLELGEVAINTYDGKMYIKKSTDGIESIVEIGTGGGGGSGNTSISIGDTPPAGPTAGNLWWDSSVGKLKIYYNDGTSSQWVDASSNTFGSGGTSSFLLAASTGAPQSILSGDTISILAGSGILTSTGEDSVTVAVDLTTIPTISSLGAVAFSSSYSDLLDQPTLFSGSYVDLTNKPTFATVATTGSYTDLLNKPSLFSGSYTDLTNKPTLFSGSYTDLTDKPTLATVATTGSYNDLLNKPTLFSGSYTDLTNKPTFATVATSGSYTDLLNRPTLATVATSGSYTDLSNKPTIITIPDVAAATGDIHGILDRTASTISFVDATRTLTIAPVSGSWDFYHKGTLYTVNTAKSITIANTSGARFIRINPATLTLEDGGPVPDFVNDVVIAYIYYDAVGGKALIVGDERHGSKRDTTWHSNQHLNVGTIWRSGGGLTYTLNNASSISIGVGTPLAIADEDLLHTITHSATPSADYQQILNTAANLEVLYYDQNNSVYRATTASTSPWIAGTSLARYNSTTAGTPLSDATEGSYITYWLLATNDIRYPVKLVLGRAEHASLDAAYAEEFTEYGLSFAEQVFMYQIVLRTSSSYANTAKVIIAGVRKVTTKIANSVASLPAASHNNLTDRELVNAHPIGAITNLQSSLDAKLASADFNTLFDTRLGIGGTTTLTNLSTGDLTATGTISLPSTTTIGTVSFTELGYLDGVTSAIQTQLNGKVASTDFNTLFDNRLGIGSTTTLTNLSTGNITATGTVSLPNTTSIGDVSSTELGYLNGVTSALQTQLNDKQKVITVGTTAPTSPAIGDLWVDTN